MFTPIEFYNTTDYVGGNVIKSVCNDFVVREITPDINQSNRIGLKIRLADK